MSLSHEGIIELFRGAPRLVAEVMRAAFDLGLPDTPAQPVEATLGEVVPTEYRADLVVALEGVRVVIEVQLSKSSRKKRTWPNYVTTLEAREDCQAYLLAVTDSPDVARWAREPIVFGNPGSVFVPLVLGPESCPRITDAKVARQHPELAVLSAILRAGAEPDRESLIAAMAGAVTLDDNRDTLYGDMVLHAAGPLAQQVLEAFMSTSQGYEYRSEFARKYYSQGREEGREVGREEGREEGREVGLEEGRIAATAEAVLKVLAGRDLPVSATYREAILCCRDLATLGRWLVQALTTHSVEDLLRTAPPPPRS